MKYYFLLICLAASTLAQDDASESPASKSAPTPVAAKPRPPVAAKPRPPAPKADPTSSNRFQYHTHLSTQTIGSTEYEQICEIGLANPTGWKVGDTVQVTGRTDARTGTEESTDFFNRLAGHKILFVEDYPHNDDGNGARIWIEGHAHTEEHRIGGTKNEHTFDGAHVHRK